MKKKQHLLLVIGLLTCLSSVSALAAYTWEMTDLTADQIECEFGRLVTHPTNPNEVFVATTNFPDPLSGVVPNGSGLFKTTDKGAYWFKTNDGILADTINIMDVAISKSSPNVVYVGTLVQGVFKSTDGGGSWVKANGNFIYNGEGFPNNKWGVLAIAVDPTNANKVYISVGNVGELDIFNLSPDHPGFYYSYDGGTTWTANNAGLPARYDPILDGISRTAVAASIMVLPQKPTYVLLGMVDLFVNINLLLNKDATTDAKVFYSTQSGKGTFKEASTGLPKDIRQKPEIAGSMARISTSTVMLTGATGKNIAIWGTHIGLTFDLDITGNTYFTTRGKGVYYTKTGSWTAKNSGLPNIVNWTDNCSDPDFKIMFKDTYNVSPVGVAQGNSNQYVMVGTVRSDQGVPSSNATKIYASDNEASTSWMKVWDQGLNVSPLNGYSEAAASFIAFNSDMSAIFSVIYWTDDVDCDLLDNDSGIYRMLLK